MALSALVVGANQVDLLAAKASEMTGDWKCSALGPSGPAPELLARYVENSNLWAVVAAQDAGDLKGFLVVRKRDGKTAWMVVVRAVAPQVVAFLADRVFQNTGRLVWGRVTNPTVRNAMLTIPGMIFQEPDIVRYQP